jgi:hypothetical protein
MIVGARHALYAGWILGIARANGVPLEAVVDPLGNYTDRLEGHFTLPGDIVLTFTVVVPPPPDDWVMA